MKLDLETLLKQSYRGIPYLVIGLIVFYFVMIYAFTFDRPFSDDRDILFSTRSALQEESFSGWWEWIWRQHNEHRVVITRLIFTAIDAMSETYNFRITSVIGNLSMLGMFLLLANSARTIIPAHSALAIGGIAALLFNFGSSPGIVWPMAALSNQGVLFFALASFYLITRDNNLKWLSFFTASLAILSQGNGLAVPLFCVLISLFNKRWSMAAIWTVFTAIWSLLYFQGYQSPPHHGSFHDAIVAPAQYLIFFFSFLGSAFGYPTDIHPSLDIVFLITSASVGAILALSNFFRALAPTGQFAKPLIWFNAFIILSALATASSRLMFGLEQALAPRYHINSFLLIASTILIYLDHPSDMHPIRQRLISLLPVMAILGALLVLITIPVLFLSQDAMTVHLREIPTP